MVIPMHARINVPFFGVSYAVCTRRGDTFIVPVWTSLIIIIPGCSFVLFMLFMMHVVVVVHRVVLCMSHVPFPARA